MIKYAGLFRKAVKRVLASKDKDKSSASLPNNSTVPPLPLDVLVVILQKLPPEERFVLAEVCKLWASAVDVCALNDLETSRRNWEDGKLNVRGLLYFLKKPYLKQVDLLHHMQRAIGDGLFTNMGRQFVEFDYTTGGVCLYVSTGFFMPQGGSESFRGSLVRLPSLRSEPECPNCREKHTKFRGHVLSVVCQPGQFFKLQGSFHCTLPPGKYTLGWKFLKPVNGNVVFRNMYDSTIQLKSRTRFNAGNIILRTVELDGNSFLKDSCTAIIPVADFMLQRPYGKDSLSTQTIHVDIQEISGCFVASGFFLESVVIRSRIP